MNSLTLRLPRLFVQLPQRFCSSSTTSGQSSAATNIEQNVVAKEEDPDAPIQLVKNPFHKPEDRCLFCRHGELFVWSFECKKLRHDFSTRSFECKKLEHGFSIRSFECKKLGHGYFYWSFECKKLKRC